LRALGVSEDLANGSIRLGLGRFTTAAEVDFAADALADAASRLHNKHKVTEAARAPT
jgi:cysteine desulfurase